MRFVITNTRTQLITKNQHLFGILLKKYTRKVQGYFHSKLYKQGKWDGGKKFFSLTGRFDTGLLPFIQADLDRAGLPYEIEDNREFFEMGSPDVEGLTLRDYQEEFVESALKQRRCIIKAPTAAGKTAIMISILKAIGDRKGILFFSKKSILEQTYNDLVKFGFDPGVCFGEGYILKDMMLCTIQSVEKIMASHLKTAEYIMFDEIQEFSNGKLGVACMTSFPKASVRIGLTATVPTDDIPKMNAIGGLGPVLEKVSVTELIEDKWLTPPVITMINRENAMEEDDTKISYVDSYNKFIVNNDLRNSMIRLLTEQFAQGEHSKTLILVKSLEHAKVLHELLPDSIMCQGSDPLSVRNKAIKEFKGRTHGILIGTIIFQTGINIPEITHYINARGLKSEIATVQALGRALRLHETKKEVYIYDFLDKERYLGKHAKARRASYKKLGLEVKIHG